MALAQEGGTTELETPAQIAKYAAAGASMCIAAMSAAYAQSKIGSAAAGTLAERPEVGMNMIIMMALPEVIVLLGFVIAFMIGTM
ncbi:MAG: ATPase [Coriobacteriia bacterium]|nr:ATPase [Coriobacteriia bacterium]